MNHETTITFRVDADLRAAFQKAADSRHRPAAQVLREFMRFFVAQAQQPSPRITEAERQRRQEAVSYARASVGLEGFVLNEADEEHAQRFINGEIDMGAFVQRGL